MTAAYNVHSRQRIVNLCGRAVRIVDKDGIPVQNEPYLPVAFDELRIQSGTVRISNLGHESNDDARKVTMKVEPDVCYIISHSMAEYLLSHDYPIEDLFTTDPSTDMEDDEGCIECMYLLEPR